MFGAIAPNKPSIFIHVPAWISKAFRTSTVPQLAFSNSSLILAISNYLPFTTRKLHSLNLQAFSAVLPVSKEPGLVKCPNSKEQKPKSLPWWSTQKETCQLLSQALHVACKENSRCARCCKWVKSTEAAFLYEECTALLSLVNSPCQLLGKEWSWIMNGERMWPTYFWMGNGLTDKQCTNRSFMRPRSAPWSEQCCAHPLGIWAHDASLCCSLRLQFAPINWWKSFRNLPLQS